MPITFVTPGGKPDVSGNVALPPPPPFDPPPPNPPVASEPALTAFELAPGMVGCSAVPWLFTPVNGIAAVNCAPGELM